MRCSSPPVGVRPIVGRARASGLNRRVGGPRRALRPCRSARIVGLAAALCGALALAAPRARVSGQPPPTRPTATAASTAAPAAGAPTLSVDEAAVVAVDEAAVVAVARSLNCPICQGRNLVECPLPVCEEMRTEIRTRLAAGEDRAAVIQHFVDYYGPAVRNTPPLSGPLALAWWVPLVMLVGGGWLVARLVTARAGSGVTSSGAAPSADAERFAALLERMAAGPDEDAPR